MLVLLLSGCFTTTVRFPPDLWVWDTGGPFFDSGIHDTASPPTPVPAGEIGTVDTFAGGCNPGDTVWLLEVTTFGWTDDARVFMSRPGGMLEEHALLLIDSDPEGAWDRYQGGPLEAGVDPVAFAPGSNSTYACAVEDEVSFGVVLRDRFGAVSECVTWGPDRVDLGDQLEAFEAGISARGCLATP
ncbi:MAG: hypothetical protein R3F61_00430 [Myxococcota bacterium]